ncbi:MAG: UDP-N-acetylglucosamine 1-carboxyvinyltransferase [Firmicutes bacterium]|jgi:UDP-N-acetylglucosamine 1-carboxyvinyltransferase|nr:UDP-N-acetylglucosamine 1-carboxyvinyltransferase [Bacillota bacterium]
MESETLIVQGGIPLRGRIRTKGSKNASLPIMAAALLSAEKIILQGVPDLLDVQTMIAVLESLGAAVRFRPREETIEITPGSALSCEPPPALVQQMRASFLVLGPLLARCGKVRLSLPGGCAIGSRPVNLHLKGLSAMGANLEVRGGCIEGETGGLRGARIYLDYPSVGATENIMAAATLARGTTILENAALEPEIVDLANFLNSMGAKISGAGTTTIRIDGVEALGATKHTVIPDRIEAGTLMLSGVISGGDIIVENIVPDYLKPLLAKLREVGAVVEEIEPTAIRVASSGTLKAVDLKTLPYPGFPTDLQPQFMTLLALAEGTSIVTETVFENRFRHVEGLSRLGAQIKVEGHHAIIQGTRMLTGAPVCASDLRAGAALLLAALAAEGVTEISGIVHLRRGYSRLEERLSRLGARIEIGRQVSDRALGLGS